MSNTKKRVVKDFEKLDTEIQEQIKLSFPYGFSENLITFKNKDGDIVSALPFETDDIYYLVRMSKSEAQALIEDDDDYDEDGTLKEEVREDYEEKYEDDLEEEEEEKGYGDDDYTDDEEEEDE